MSAATDFAKSVQASRKWSEPGKVTLRGSDFHGSGWRSMTAPDDEWGWVVLWRCFENRWPDFLGLGEVES